MMKLLVGVDLQYDFMSKYGKLALPAEEIIDEVNKALSDSSYSAILLTLDTHNMNDYPASIEGQEYPPHCIFGSRGWDFMDGVHNPGIKTDYIKKITDITPPTSTTFQLGNVITFLKDQFDIWAGNTAFEDFIDKRFPNTMFEVDIIGVATDVCVFYAAKGFLERGYKVNIIESATKGISNNSFQKTIKRLDNLTKSKLIHQKAQHRGGIKH